MKTNKIFTVLCLAVISVFCFGCANNNAPSTSLSQKETFHFGWKFSRGDFPKASEYDFDDSTWQQIGVPHDWSILGPYDPNNPSGGQGGYLPTGIGWYRKDILIDRVDPAKQYLIVFDGVYMNSEVWINGHYLGLRPYGYISFRYELTPFLRFGEENVIAVKVDNSKQPNSRWYSGSGIYRNVWLVKTEKLHIGHWGTFVTTPEVNQEEALLSVKTVINNQTDKTSITTLQTTLYDATGKPVAITDTTVNTLPGKEITINQDLKKIVNYK